VCGTGRVAIQDRAGFEVCPRHQRGAEHVGADAEPGLAADGDRADGVGVRDLRGCVAQANIVKRVTDGIDRVTNGVLAPVTDAVNQVANGVVDPPAMGRWVQ
jgi:hypothetical protein